MVMNLGVVEQIGRPIEVYDDPASLFVAGFIGSPSMNFITGRRVGDDIEIATGTRVPLPPGLRATAPGEVTIGIRPEHLVQADVDGAHFRFRIDTVEALGADSMLHGTIGDNLMIARVEGHLTPPPGTEMVLSAREGTLYFFDTATGKRLRPPAAA